MLPTPRMRENAALGVSKVATYIALFSTVPSGETPGTELVDPRYKRQAASWTGGDIDGLAVASATFNVSAGAKVRGFGLYSAPTGGEYYGGNTLTAKDFAGDGTVTVTTKVRIDTTAVVTATAPSVEDNPGYSDDVVTIPDIPGVQYTYVQADGREVNQTPGRKVGQAGIYRAYALPGFTLTGTSEWTIRLSIQPRPVTFDGAGGKYTIPTTSGVSYQRDGQPVTSGTYNGTGTVTITAVSTSAYITLSGVTRWAYTFEAEAQGVTAKEPTWDDIKRTYTIPQVAGVSYKVGADIKPAGTYAAIGTVTVQAIAASGYVLIGAASWSHTFPSQIVPVHNFVRNPRAVNVADTTWRTADSNQSGAFVSVTGFGATTTAYEMTVTDPSSKWLGVSYDIADSATLAKIPTPTATNRLYGGITAQPTKACTLYAEVVWFDAAWNNLGTSILAQGIACAANEAKALIGPFTDRPANATRLSIAVLATSGLTTGDKLRASNAYVGESDAPFDGDTPDVAPYRYDWDGVRNNSTSTRSDAASTAPIVVTPQAPTSSGLKYTIPASQGVEYLINSIVVPVGIYDGQAGQTFTVTCRAIAGYVIAGNAQTTWQISFTPGSNTNFGLDQDPRFRTVARISDTAWAYQKLPDVTPKWEHSDYAIADLIAGRDRSGYAMDFSMNDTGAISMMKATNRDRTVDVRWPMSGYGSNNGAGQTCWWLKGPVHIPADFFIPGSTDKSVSIWNPDQDRITELWLTAWEGDHLTCGWGGDIMGISKWDGRYSNNEGVAACGMSFIAFNTRFVELQAFQEKGIHIPHVIGLMNDQFYSGPNANWTYWSWPAARTDGRSGDPRKLAEGQLVRLPKSVNIEALNLKPLAKALAYAAQEYGMIICDTSDGVAIYGEHEHNVAANAPGFNLPGFINTEHNWAFEAMYDFPLHLLEALPPTQTPFPWQIGTGGGGGTTPPPSTTGSIHVTTTNITSSTVEISWTFVDMDRVSPVVVGRNGSDSSGAGPWSGETTATSFTFTKLRSNTSYTFTVTAGGVTGSVTAQTAAPPTGGGGGGTIPAGWISGAACQGVPDGSFGAWRGEPVKIAGTWQPHPDWAMGPGKEYGDWQESLDYGWQGWVNRSWGDTYQKAANGELEGRWAEHLQTIKDLRAGRPGIVYIRPGFEFNGTWMSNYFVNPGEEGLFIAAWRRLRTIQQQIAPNETRLVWCPNCDGNMDAKTAWPGSEYVDVVGVDAYNQYPWTNDETSFWAKMTSEAGLETWRQWALQQGLPMAVCEWASNAEARYDGGAGGDAPNYIRLFNQWCIDHAGNGPGQIHYDVFFNCPYDGNRFALWPSTNQPESAAAYQSCVWGSPTNSDGTTTPTPPGGTGGTPAIVGLEATDITASTVTISWSTAYMTSTTVTVGRDGYDTTGFGPWSGPTSGTSFTFTKLRPNTAYKFTVTGTGGVSASVTVTTAELGGGGTVPIGQPGVVLNGVGWDSDGYGRINEFGSWRGYPVEIVSAWAGTNDSMAHFYMGPALRDGGYRGQVVIANGGPQDKGSGEGLNGHTWASAASGSMDDTWRSQCNEAAQYTQYFPQIIFSFAHEMNGSWFGWSIHSGNVANYHRAFDRFIGIARSIIPNVKVAQIFNYNSHSDVTNEQIYHGAVDLLGIDWYDTTHITNESAFQSRMWQTDWHGTDGGLSHFADWARSKGKRIYFQEWGCSDADQYDNPWIINRMAQWFKENSDVVYGQSYFNIQDRIRLYPNTNLPNAANAYRSAFGSAW